VESALRVRMRHVVALGCGAIAFASLFADRVGAERDGVALHELSAGIEIEFSFGLFHHDRERFGRLGVGERFDGARAKEASGQEHEKIAGDAHAPSSIVASIS
jgi:hypothetical protein